MFYIILCALALTFQHVPLLVGTVYLVDRIKYGSYYFSTTQCAIYFVCTLIAFILYILLLVFSIQSFKGRSEMLKPIFVLGAIQIFVLLMANHFTMVYDSMTNVLILANLVIALLITIKSSIRCNSTKAKPSSITDISKADISNYDEKSGTPDENMELLIKYHDLLKNGIITQEEFDEKKQDLL